MVSSSSKARGLGRRGRVSSMRRPQTSHGAVSMQSRTGLPSFSRKDCTQSSTSGAGLSSSAPSQRRGKKPCIFHITLYNKQQNYSKGRNCIHAAHHLGPGHGAARGGASAPGTAQPQVHDGFKIGKPAAQLQPGGRPLHRPPFSQRASTAAGRPRPASCGATFWAIGSPRRP